MRRIMAAAAVLALGLALAGCNETLAERVENKATCEELGGTYLEFENGLTYTYWYWDCDLGEKN